VVVETSGDRADGRDGGV